MMAYTGAGLKALAPLLLTMPDGIHFDTRMGVEPAVEFIAYTQKEVADIRTFFPGALWKKHYRSDLEWWEYEISWAGTYVRIYACREAPPSCRAIEETIIVKERVPVTFEEREVEKKVIRWDCSQEEVTP
jgi:hypothetical protein